MTDLELTKRELRKFFEEHKNLLTLETPFEKWNNSIILFSTNAEVKGKINFMLNNIEFRLKHFIWMPYTKSEMRDYDIRNWNIHTIKKIKDETGEFGFPCDSSGKFLFERIPTLCQNIKDAKLNYLDECERNRIKEEKEKERNKKIQLSKNQSAVLLDLDKDKDGVIDLIENDFNKLFAKNQKRVMEMDKNYIHQFVKVSNFIKTKKQNTQRIFESIRDTSSQEELEERVSLLKNQIHSYELLVFHSINMIGALVSEDLITFYEIYESFDKLSMFNSNWENEVSEKLTNIGDKLDDLMQSIYNMEQNIVSELSHLSYVTQASFEDLNSSVTNQLREVESSINTNNLLTGIQAYQLYKINKNTKGLSS